MERGSGVAAGEYDDWRAEGCKVIDKFLPFVSGKLAFIGDVC